MIRKKDKPAETKQKIEISIPISESSWKKLKVKATLKNTNPQELASDLVSKGLRRRSGRDPDKRKRKIRCVWTPIRFLL